MPRWSGDDAPEPAPLPRGWLPEATPREGTPLWEITVVRVMAATEMRASTLLDLRPPSAWPSVLGSWWRPAAALAAAAAALLWMIPTEPSSPLPGAGELPLSVMATKGDPAALLAGLGVEADPVLALIALEGRTP
jgi:hypothetical protein